MSSTLTLCFYLQKGSKDKRSSLFVETINNEEEESVETKVSLSTYKLHCHVQGPVK
jgi:hypothetical protein